MGTAGTGVTQSRPGALFVVTNSVLADIRYGELSFSYPPRLQLPWCARAETQRSGGATQGVVPPAEEKLWLVYINASVYTRP